jgi:hypothetical protein
LKFQFPTVQRARDSVGRHGDIARGEYRLAVGRCARFKLPGYPSSDGLRRFQDNFPRFEERFEVGEDARPAAGNDLDELRLPRDLSHLVVVSLTAPAIGSRSIVQ